MSDDPYLLFPPQLSDAEASALVDFLCELAAAADSHYVAQIIRYRQRQQSTSGGLKEIATKEIVL